MPNFFQRRSSALNGDVASPGRSASPRMSMPSAAVPPVSGNASAAGAAPSLLSPGGAGGGGGAGNQSSIHKAPSPFWTEYYGAVIVVLTALFIGGGTLLIRPKVLEYRQLQGSVALASSVLADERGYLDSLQGSIGAAQSIPAQTLADVEEALPSTVDVPKTLTMLAAFTKEYGADLGGVQFTTAGGGEAGAVQVMEIGISVTLNGYSGLRQFLAGLERNMRIFDLQGITVSAGGGGSDGATLSGQSYSFQLRTYYLPQRRTTTPLPIPEPLSRAPRSSMEESPL